MSLVTLINESCHMYERVMLNICMSHVTCINKSCYTYERVRTQETKGTMSYVTYTLTQGTRGLTRRWSMCGGQRR